MLIITTPQKIKGAKTYPRVREFFLRRTKVRTSRNMVAANIADKIGETTHEAIIGATPVK